MIDQLINKMKTLSLLLSFFMVITSAKAELSRTDFEKIQTLLQPNPDESWRTIPWKISVLEAQKNRRRRRANRFSSGRWMATRWAAPETMACSTVSRLLPILIS